MSTLYFATLNPQSSRYAEWCEIFDCHHVPLLSAQERIATLGSEINVPIYMLDLAELTAMQRSRLAYRVASKFGCSITEVREQMDFVGFPIRKDDVIVAFTMRCFV